MKKLYKIKNIDKTYAVPAPYGFLIKKTDNGTWTSACYDERSQTNIRDIRPDIQEYIFLEPNTIVMQLDDIIAGGSLEAFSQTIKNKYIPGGSYIPCLLDERLMLIKEDFLNPLY